MNSCYSTPPGLCPNHFPLHLPSLKECIFKKRRYFIYASAMFFFFCCLNKLRAGTELALLRYLYESTVLAPVKSTSLLVSRNPKTRLKSWNVYSFIYTFLEAQPKTLILCLPVCLQFILKFCQFRGCGEDRY